MTSKCKNSSGNSSRRRVVSLQSFEHLNTISILNKSIDHRKFLSTCFCDNINSFLITFLLRASQKIKKEKKKLCHHHNINLVCTIINHSLQVMSAPERNCTFVVKTAFERNGLSGWGSPSAAFCSMKQLGIFLFTPGQNASSWQCYPQF